MYKVLWLSENGSLERFKGKIIEVLDKKYYSFPGESYWGVQCLVEVEDEQNE